MLMISKNVCDAKRVKRVTTHWNTLYAAENFEIRTTRGASRDESDLRAISMGLLVGPKTGAKASPDRAAKATTPKVRHSASSFPAGLPRDGQHTRRRHGRGN
jgi:hypothetical protein